ncbi:hypothetical protein [Caballeronia sp. LZ034LL]|uniref:hypothetical protein n=1 Tax=Caballeronia sp. LZ034LL TaxID=3038567 RepID=UPI0028556DAE|nr:hypothetical protein [Caballeronia sp. LZ034LL]MDR5839321.1 hypothetical protein [Caballeronia sp. LZ034LL]
MHAVSQLQQLEAGLESAKAQVELRNQIAKLMDNREFRKVIREAFCEKECARYAQESADPALPDRQRADALAMAQAAGHLKRWLAVQMVMGDNAVGQIPDYEQMIEHVRAGGDVEELGGE